MQRLWCNGGWSVFVAHFLAPGVLPQEITPPANKTNMGIDDANESSPKAFARYNRFALLNPRGEGFSFCKRDTPVLNVEQDLCSLGLYTYSD